MRIVHVSTSDHLGGAARGALWLHRGLLALGLDSMMVVADSRSEVPGVTSDTKSFRRFKSKARNRLNKLPLLVYPRRRSELFSPAMLSGNVVNAVRRLRPDIVHLHWITGGFVKPEDLVRFDRPIVWTLRDMWPFTGGCHYSDGCERFLATCGSCPHLGSRRDKDLSWRLLMRKHHACHGIDLVPVAISSWIQIQAQKSSLFRNLDVRLIPNAVDVEFWTPHKQEPARRALGLPTKGRVVLMVALQPFTDERKGFLSFARACQILANRGYAEKLHAVVVGASEPSGGLSLGLDATFLGYASDDEAIRLAYSAADLTVVPSSQEAFGKTAAESLSCGRPVVSFDSTGLVDVVDHQLTGYRAQPGNPEDLAEGIKWVLEDADRWDTLSRASRHAAVTRFSQPLQAESYAALYNEIARNHRDPTS